MNDNIHAVADHTLTCGHVLGFDGGLDGRERAGGERVEDKGEC